MVLAQSGKKIIQFVVRVRALSEFWKEVFVLVAMMQTEIPAKKRGGGFRVSAIHMTGLGEPRQGGTNEPLASMVRRDIVERLLEQCRGKILDD